MQVEMLTSVVSESSCLHEGKTYDLDNKRAAFLVRHGQAKRLKPNGKPAGKTKEPPEVSGAEGTDKPPEEARGTDTKETSPKEEG